MPIITTTETAQFFAAILPQLNETTTARLIVETAAILKEEKNKEQSK